MRILDSEAHALNPAGIDCCYPMSPRWRYPYIPGALPRIRTVVAESVREGRFDDLTDTLIARMDRHGVEKAVIMRGAFPARNADLAAIVARHPDRFAAFAAWDTEAPVGSPPRESPQGLAALERGLTEHGCLGVGEVELRGSRRWRRRMPGRATCRPWRSAASTRSRSCSTPATTAARCRWPYKNPIMLEPLAFEFPDVPILVCHMGKYDTTFFEYAMMLARKCQNVYLTTSNARRDFIERAVEEIGPERLIFGSDWSMQHGILGEANGFDVYEKNLDAVRAARLDEGEKALILGGNLAGLLGI